MSPGVLIDVAPWCPDYPGPGAGDCELEAILLMIVLSRGAVSPLHCLHCPHSPVVTLYCYNVGCNVVMDNVVMCRYNVVFTHDGLTNAGVNSCH